MFINSYDIAVSTIGEDTPYFSSEYIQNNEKLDEMKRICSLIDNMAARHNASNLKFKIDKSNLTYIFYVTCPDIVINDQDDSFISLIKSAKQISISVNNKKEMVCIFEFDGIWI